MKYAAAYLLAAAAGKDKPTAKDVKKILGAIEAEIDDDALNKIVDQLKDSTIHEVIAKGRETLKSVPMGGGGGAAAPAAAAGDAAPAAAAAAAVVEEEEEEEE